ncbi:hypothetical protein GCM10028787_31180 [Brachybacterium horti]
MAADGRAGLGIGGSAMTETQHPSELEAAMDNLETLLEAVSVARQKVRDRKRRAVPRQAPQRPGSDSDDVLEEDPEDLQEPSEEEPAELDGEELDDAELDGEELDGEESAEQLADEAPASWSVYDPLTPAGPKVRTYMAEMAVEGRHREWIKRTLEDAGPGAEFLMEDSIARHQVYRAAAERMVDVDGVAVDHAAAIVERTGLENLPWHDLEGEALEGELAEVRRSGLSTEEQTILFADRIAVVQEQLAAEHSEGTPAPQDAAGFTSEIRLPIMRDAVGAAALFGDEATEDVQQYVEALGAQVEDGELVIPVEGHGNDLDVSVDPAVSAWRSVTPDELVSAAVYGEESANLAYIRSAAGEEAIIGPAGEVPSPGQERGQIRPTEDGLSIEAGIARDEVSPAVWEELQAEFGAPEPDSEVLFVPVSADPHADPVAEISRAREDMPGSLFAKNEEYERQLLARREASLAAADPGVWTQPAGQEAYVDLIEKQRADGSVEAVVWVDDQQQPTTHPEGVPSVWMDEKGAVTALGHYDNGQPTGTWGWTDRETGTFVSDRAEMSKDGPVAGTQQHRESAEDGWTSVGDSAEPGKSTPDSAMTTRSDEVEMDGAASMSDLSPSPGPSKPSHSATPPLPDPTGPSHGPRFH